MIFKKKFWFKLNVGSGSKLTGKIIRIWISSVAEPKLLNFGFGSTFSFFVLSPGRALSIVRFMTLVWDCVYCCSDSPVWGDLVPGQNPLRGRLQGQPALRRLWTDRGTYGASPLVWRIRISSDLHYFAGSALLPVWGSGSSEKRLLDLLIRTKFLWITGMRRRLLTHTSFISAKTVVLIVLYNTFSMYTV